MTLPSSPLASGIKPTLVFQHGWAFDASFWAPLRAALSEWPQRTLDRGYFGDACPTDVAPPDVALSHAAPSDATPSDAVATDRAAPVVWIGHSFGFMRGLASIAAGGNVDGLISINGFPRFSAAPDFTHGTPSRVVERMATRLRTHTGPVVDDFRQRCGAPARSPTQSPTCLEPLLSDLLALRDEDYRATLLAYAGPLLALASRDDPIVSAAMTQQAFCDREIVWHSGHRDADEVAMFDTGSGSRAGGTGGDGGDGGVPSTGSDRRTGSIDSGGHLLPSIASAWCAQRIDAFLRHNWP